MTRDAYDEWLDNRTAIDEAKIVRRDRDFHLILYLDDGQRFDYRIGNPEALEYEVQRTIGEWLDESGRLPAAITAARRYFEQKLTTEMREATGRDDLDVRFDTRSVLRRFEEDGA